MKWINAGERLPMEIRKVHWRDADSKLPITAHIAFRYSISENESDLVEWLDESNNVVKSAGMKMAEYFYVDENMKRLYPEIKINELNEKTKNLIFCLQQIRGHFMPDHWVNIKITKAIKDYEMGNKERDFKLIEGWNNFASEYKNIDPPKSVETMIDEYLAAIA